MMPRFAADKLVGYAEALLQASGLTASRARTVAEILVEGDLFGHTTHGLQLLPGYLKEIDAGSMTTDGDPETLAEKIVAMHKIFGNDRCLIQMAIGIMPHAKIMKAIELFGTKVAPIVRKETGKPA